MPLPDFKWPISYQRRSFFPIVSIVGSAAGGTISGTRGIFAVIIPAQSAHQQ